MRNFFRYVVAGLVLIIVAMSSMLITMRFAIHVREVVIPKFVGMTPQAAEQLAASSGLRLLRESRFYSSEIPAGNIVSQEPPPGQKVRKGWQVRIAESMGPQQIVIPNVVGDSPRAAELNVKRRGLELGSVAGIALPGQTPDQVIAQSPPPDAQDVATPKVSILVAAPAEDEAFVMPDLNGMKLAEASAAVADAGLKVGSVTIASTASSGMPTLNPAASKPAALGSSDPVVVKQTPAPGQRVTAGTVVTFEIAR